MSRSIRENGVVFFIKVMTPLPGRVPGVTWVTQGADRAVYLVGGNGILMPWKVSCKQIQDGPLFCMRRVLRSSKLPLYPLQFHWIISAIKSGVGVSIVSVPA